MSFLPCTMNTNRLMYFLFKKVCMNIDTIMKKAVTVDIKLPTFIELYDNSIATPSISATDAKTDQSNEALINLLG